MTERLEHQLTEFKDGVNRLPETREPPPTTLQIIRNNQQERDWQRLLFHYLSPDRAHGLNHGFLTHVLSALAGRDDTEFSFSRLDLADVAVEQEATLSNGRIPDAVIWASEDWFLCWELKVDAPEGEDQTRDYVAAGSFRSIGLAKEAVPASRHHYVFLAPERTITPDSEDSPPEAPEFVPVSWEWVASTIQSFLSESHGEYPARTMSQLGTFAGTIRSELTMTDYQENQAEKVELYLDHYEEIAEVQQAFDEQWETFTGTWGKRLARALNTATTVEDAAVPDEYVSVELTLDNSDRRLWTFRQGHADWSWMFPQEWWTTLDDREPIFDPATPQARVGFLHRLDWNKDDTLRNHELKFYLRNAPSAHDPFYDGFARRFNEDDDIPGLLPAETTRPGVKSNVLQGTYDINAEAHGGLLEGYITALAQAIEDHVVSNPTLVAKVDELHHRTVEADTQF